jgi:hypothetical protein
LDAVLQVVQKLLLAFDCQELYGKDQFLSHHNVEAAFVLALVSHAHQREVKFVCKAFGGDH